VKIVDARSGKVVEIGKPVKNGSDPEDWYTILRVNFRTLLTRTAVVVRHDGRREKVTCPVKVLPRLTHGLRFPVRDTFALIYPS
jgi:hypothetical protein